MKLNTTKQLLQLYKELSQTYGWIKWWHKATQLEMIVGAILVQNTNWNNAALALSELKKHKLLSIEAINSLTLPHLKKHIKSAGLYNQKAKYLKAISKFLAENGGIGALRRLETTALRKKLMTVYGIGNETADVILLYVFKRPVFIADNYSQRLLLERRIVKNKLSYKKLQIIIHDALKPDLNLYSQYHALIVHHGKNFKK